MPYKEGLCGIPVEECRYGYCVLRTWVTRGWPSKEGRKAEFGRLKKIAKEHPEQLPSICSNASVSVNR